MAKTLRFRAWIASALMFAASPLSGCGSSDGLPTRYAVSGTVKFKGEPLKKGVINFIPGTEDGHPASGQIEDGVYSLTTLQPGDGAIPGDYKVTISDRQLDGESLQAESDALAKKRKVTYNRIPPELQAKAVAKKKASGTLPEKFDNPTTSGLEKKVEAKSNSFDFDLAE